MVPRRFPILLALISNSCFLFESYNMGKSLFDSEMVPLDILFISWYLNSFSKKVRRRFLYDPTNWGTRVLRPRFWKKYHQIYLGGIQKLRWPFFALFWPPTYLWLTLLLNRDYYYSWHLVNHLPTPFGQRSFWMPPNVKESFNSISVFGLGGSSFC